MDYRKILIAYIEHVGEQEGVDFLPAGKGGLPSLSRDECRALYEAAAEVDCIESHRDRLLRAATNTDAG